ncbi:hypothetical protein AK812_SmicGene37931 [Symbiodinium microadriaticum]|uniref:Uncharacterized protein n=1 Tax=Symbiodinium microadriaticum TaxID=2951 RepID=A0A1Q9CFA0_SYMMI|nr:hypothetical protein AK812_SmicGene37931 [Symbiodinium microadriaticum]CAE7740408.1 unnamed protein product [Symbiodinium microadriaticum]
MPFWKSPGSVIAIDSRAVNDKLFAVHIVGTCYRHDFLKLAGLAADAEDEVYFRDLPWPLPDQSPVVPQHGDLVLIRHGPPLVVYLKITQTPPGYLALRGPLLLPQPPGHKTAHRPARQEIITGQAYFLASTLVETLVEHFHTGDPFNELVDVLAKGHQKSLPVATSSRPGGANLPLTFVVTPMDGSKAEDPAAAEARWIRHFSSIEAGGPQSPELIMQQCRARQAAIDLTDYDIESHEIVTRAQIEDGLRASTPGRAAGKDRVPADLLRVCPAGLSRPLFPIVLKFAMRLQEPVQWKGGELHSIWKRKGSPLDCESYRAILVSSSIGKAVHGSLRRHCSTYFEQAAMPLQVGGRAGFPVQFVLQAARLWQERCRAHRTSCALIFLDLKEAFHRVARALVHGGQPDEASINNAIATLGLDPAVGPRLQAYVRDKSLISEAGGPPVLSRMVAETNSDTWFSHGALEGTAIVQAGTRPGDNLADLIFSFLFAELLNTLRQRFAQEGLSCALPWNDKWLGASLDAVRNTRADDVERPIDATWMDDLALLVEDSRPDRLLEKVAAVATATLDECIKATLVPNLAEGKTECVVALYGPGSKKTSSEVFRGSSPDIQLHSDIWPNARLRLVTTYKHVGGIIQAGGGTTKEVRSRLGAAWAAFRQHRRQVFSSPLVHIRDKSVLFSAVVESTLLFGVGAWPAHDPVATRKFQGALVCMARLMLRPRFSYAEARHMSGLYALACARILPAEVAISLEHSMHLAGLESSVLALAFRNPMSPLGKSRLALHVLMPVDGNG